MAAPASNNSNNIDLTGTLAAACRADPAAEAQLKEWGRTSLGDYAHALAVEIGAPNRPPDVRQMAGLMLKNLLYGKAAGYVREQHQRWGNLGAQRQPIKDALLSSMACPELKAAHSAALAASEIAAFELPHQQWNEFVPTLMDRVRGGSEKGIAPSVQLASLECLGYTAERVSELEGLLGEEVPELHESVVDNMLTTIVEGMQATRSNDMRLAATTALRNSLSFVHKNMQLKAERDFIFQAIGEAAQCTAVEVRVLAYNCLDQIAEMYYESMQEYMTVIYQLTTDAIRNPSEDESVKMAAIEFWSTVAGVEQVLLEEERDLEGTGTALGRPPCLQYTKLAMEQLVPLLLETLTKQDEEVVEVDAWNLQAAGAVCLECISVAVEGLILPSVMPFVEQNITNPDWRLRDAAIVAFASILEGPDTGTVGNFVVQAIPVVLNAFQDPHLMVRDSAVHCIAKIFRQHGTAVPPEMLQIVLQSLIAKVQESHVVAAHACSAIFNIAQGCRTPEVLPSNALSHAMVPLLQALLAATDRQDASESNLRVSAMSAAAELVSAAAADTKPVLREFLPVIVQRMEAALRMQAANTEDSENKEILLGLLCALFTVLFQRLDRQDVLPYVDPCMQFLLETLQQRLCVEEAVLSVGAVAATLEQDFVKYLPVFMPFLLQGLTSFQEQSLCTVSVGVVVDVCNAAGPQVQPYCDSIIAALRHALEDDNVTRDLKPIVIACFGDIALALGAAYEPYLQISGTMLTQAAANTYSAQGDDDMVAFINSLRLAILEAYSGIIMGLSEGNVLHVLVPLVPHIIQFLQILSMPESNRDEDVVLKAVALIGDIAGEMGNEPAVRQQILQPFVDSLLQEALADPATRDTALWTQGKVQQMMQQAA